MELKLKDWKWNICIIINIKYDGIFYIIYYSVYKFWLNIGNIFKSWVIG